MQGLFTHINTQSKFHNAIYSMQHKQETIVMQHSSIVPLLAQASIQTLLTYEASILSKSQCLFGPTLTMTSRLDG